MVIQRNNQTASDEQLFFAHSLHMFITQLRCTVWIRFAKGSYFNVSMFYRFYFSVLSFSALQNKTLLKIDDKITEKNIAIQ